jgi:hypothetical protein
LKKEAMADTILRKNIIKELGIDTLPEKKQEEILLRIGKIIFQAVLIRVMERLNSKEKDEFTELLVKKPNDEEAILGFLKSKIPDLDEIVNEEVATFKREVVNFAKEIKE